MSFTRRSVLVGTAGVFSTGTLTSRLSTQALARSPVDPGGVGVAIGVGDDQTLDGLSDTVTIERVPDPFRGDGNQGNGQGGGGGQVLRITSRPQERGRGNGNQGNDESDEEPEHTFDIGISLINVEDRDLTVADIAHYERDDGGGGQDAPDAGMAYDWAATEADVVGLDTEHEGVGSPDDVWFFLDDSSETDGDAVDDRSGPFFTNAKPVFRTSYADRDEAASQDTRDWAYEEWNTRTVTDEFEAHGWKELSTAARNFVHLEDNIVESYGDTRVVGVGISRGDPYWGPSTLDTYYRNLYVNGERYRLPATLQLGPPGRP